MSKLPSDTQAAAVCSSPTRLVLLIVTGGDRMLWALALLALGLGPRAYGEYGHNPCLCLQCGLAAGRRPESILSSTSRMGNFLNMLINKKNPLAFESV